MPDPVPSYLEQHAAIVGTTGSGKTYKAKRDVELLLQAGRRVVVLDPTGAWWGLRSNASGTGPGFPVAVLGGRHADLPLPAEAGAPLGELLATRTTSAILDLSDFTFGEQRRFVQHLAEALYHHNRDALHLVIDEADEFAPQRPLPDQTVLSSRIARIVQRGRIRGFRVMLITQRPAVLHKDVLSQAKSLTAMKLTAPQDRKALGAWIEGQADPAEGKRILAELPRLPTGEGFFWFPAEGVLERRRFPPITTFDSSATPDADAPIALPAGKSALDLTELRAALADHPTATPSQGKHAPDLEAARRQAHAAARAEAEAEIRALRAEVERLRTVLRQISTLSIGAAPEANATQVPSSTPQPQHRPAATPPRSQGGAELRILKVLAQRHPARLTEAQWATLARMKRSGGTWQTYKSRLRTAGLVQQQDGLWSPTEAGLHAAGTVPDQPDTPEAVLALWKAALGSGPARILDALIGAGGTMERRALADAVQMTATGGTFQTYLSRLRSNDLVRANGTRIVLAPELQGR